MSISRKFLQPCLNTFRVAIRSNHAVATKSKVEYYQALEIPPNATLTEVREAYFRKVKDCHPDINPSEEAKKQFASVQEAYKTLSNVDKRIGYDRTIVNSKSASVKSKEGFEVPPETKEEQEARVAKKVEDQEVYYTTKKEISSTRLGSTARSWTTRDEWGSGARTIKLNKIENRMTVAEAEAIFKATSLYKTDEKLQPYVMKVKEYIQNKYEFGGPKDDTEDKETISDLKKHFWKYGAVMALICTLSSWDFLTRKGYIKDPLERGPI